MTKQTLTALMLFVAIFIYGQKAVVPAGGNAIGRGGSSSYTIGQVNYKNSTTDGISNSEGIQHAYEIIEVETKKKIIESNLVFTVYPNPSKDLVNIKIDNFIQGVMSYELISASGQLIFSKKSTENLTTISMGNLAQGTYYIKVASDETPIKTFKIIKN